MIIVLSPKLLGFTVVGASAPIIGTVVYTTLPLEEQVMLAVTAEPLGDIPDTEIKFGEDRNYRCKFGNLIDENCTLEVFNIDQAKKWADLNTIKTGTTTNSEDTEDSKKIDKNTLKSPNNYFKVVVSPNIVHSINWANETRKLEVIPNGRNPDVGDVSAKYAALTPLLSFGEKTNKTKNNVFLVKAAEFVDSTESTLTFNTATNKTTSGTGNTGSSGTDTSTTPTAIIGPQKCTLSWTDISVEKNRRDCLIKSFVSTTPTQSTSSSTINGLTVENIETAKATLNKDHYYLIQFETPLTDYEVSYSDAFYVVYNTSSTWSKKVKFTEPKRAVIVPDADFVENLLILP